ncbi:MAG: hypothetical protein HYS34_10875 [Acidobacteria bacterium]|nr:hypothetical protein [Acidobacteriota bacterium]
MRSITLNLATRPFRNNLAVGSALWAVAAAAVLASAYNGYVFLNYGGRYGDLQREERQHLQRLATLQAEERKNSREIQARDFRRLYGRGQFAGDQILKRSFSWTLLFNKLEGVIPAEVMMTAIHPHIASEGIVIRVDGVAKNHGALIGFEDALLKSPVFARVYPASERRLNPSRPEISFALNFDYLPAKATGGIAAIASVEGPAEGGGPARTAGDEPAPPATPAAAPVAGPPAGAPAASGTPEVIGTAGRDGMPRTPEVLARLVAAPGGIYPDTPPPSGKEPAGAAKKSPGRRRGTKGAPASATPAPAPPAPAGAGLATPAQAAPAGKQRLPAGSGDPAGGGTAASGIPVIVSPAIWQDGYAAARPPLVAGLPARRDPNLGPPPAKKPKAPRVPEPVPATRLDVPLKFRARPLPVVCEALSTAHGARFEIDPAVDPRTTVTADLSGKNLKDALAVISRLTGLKFHRIDDGRYRVVTVAGGEPMSEKPIREEPLAAGEDGP